MRRERELAKNTCILSFGVFTPKLFAIIVTPILTSKLTKAEYGIYDLIVIIVSLLMPVVTLELTSAAFRFLIEKKDNKEESKKIVTTIYTFVLAMAAVTSSILLLFIGDRLGHNRILVSLYFVFDILLITTEQIMRGLGRNILYSLSCVVKSLTNLVLIVILLGVIDPTNKGLTGLLISLTASTGAALVVVFISGKVLTYISPKAFSFSKLKDMLMYSWPMVPNNLSGWVLRVSDRLVITGALGIEMNAVYAVANKLPSLFQVFQSTFVLAWQENASIAVKDNDSGNYYSQMINAVSNMLIGVMACLIAATPVLFRVLIRGDYQEAYNQIPVLYTAMVFSCMSSVLGGIYIAYKKTMDVGISTMIAAAFNLMIDVLFVNLVGIWAGSISTLISYLILWLYRMSSIQKFQKMKFDFLRFTLGIASLVLMTILYFMNCLVGNILNIFLAICILWLFDKNIIQMFINLAKKKIMH